jgi:hypothetical protein
MEALFRLKSLADGFLGSATASTVNDLEIGTAPDAFDAILPNPPAGFLRLDGDAPVAVSAILAGHFAGVLHPESRSERR